MNGDTQRLSIEKMEVVFWLIIFLVQPKQFGILKEYMPTLLTYQVILNQTSSISFS